MISEEKIKEKLINNKSFKKNTLLWTSLHKNPFSWTFFSTAVLQYCPEYFDPEKFNWNSYSWAIIHYRPEFLDFNKANLKNITQNLTKYKDMSLKEIKKRAILNRL